MSLWFAQNSLPLRWQRQLLQRLKGNVIRCDLLKIHYLCGDKDNRHHGKSIDMLVVICSKFITFAVTKTTRPGRAKSSSELWFAQNSLPLRWQRQLFLQLFLLLSCCDLLKIHYLCGDKDNVEQIIKVPDEVVICSKFITFAVTKTTRRSFILLSVVLWFAQNSLPLRWQRQHIRMVESCSSVVICSKFITFAVTKTTRSHIYLYTRGCDLLKIHYLCGDKDNTAKQRETC